MRGGITSLEAIANDVDDVDIAGVLGISVDEGRRIRDLAVLATGGTVVPVAEVPSETGGDSDDPAEPDAKPEMVSVAGDGDGSSEQSPSAE